MGDACNGVSESSCIECLKDDGSRSCMGLVKPLKEESFWVLLRARFGIFVTLSFREAFSFTDFMDSGSSPLGLVVLVLETC